MDVGKKLDKEQCGDCRLCIVSMGPKANWREYFAKRKRTARGECVALYPGVDSYVNLFALCKCPEQRKQFVAELRRAYLPLGEMLLMDRAKNKRESTQ